MKDYTVKGAVSLWLSEWRCCDFTRAVSRLFSLMSLLVAAAVQAGTFSLDDGSVDTFGGTPGGDLLALNHFDTGGRTVVIDQISVLWNPLSAAVSPTVALYSDPDGDGNPSDASPLLIYPIVWLLLLPFRLVGIAVGGALHLVWAIVMLPFLVVRRLGGV